MKYKVTILPNNIELSVEEGTNLLEVQRTAGLNPDAPCGGQGTCGKCLVDLWDGTTYKTVRACQTIVDSDLTFRIKGGESHHLLESGTKRSFLLDPAIKWGTVSVEKCKFGESTSDWERLKDSLSTQFAVDQDMITSDLKTIAGLHQTLVDNEYSLDAVMYNNELLDLRKDVNPYAAAIDIGTTSVVCYLLDLAAGNEIDHTSTLNPQAQYGADVISRAEAAIDGKGTELALLIRNGINELLQKAADNAGCMTQDIYLVSIAGNTCMHHLFLDISPESLVHAPYNSTVNEELVLTASELGIGINPNGRIQMLPNIAGFVGADTAGVLLATDFDKEEDLTLVIDIGTNGEMVMGNKDRMIACSTAAGPAFEGAKIEMGMRGRAGAIDHVFADENGDISCSVIDDAQPEGICGSGLLDAVSVLLTTERMSESGKLEDGDRFYLKGDVYISQKDIREVQLAKGAIAAGIELMAEHLGIQIDDIKKVKIAGAFGNYMDPHSACVIGMIPAQLEDRIVMIGNAAGEGAKIAALNYSEFRRAEEITKKVEFLELATSPEFQDTFVDHLMFETE
ncbi:MAG: DUF4445 domain-containing protein [Lachnospiraceae bacterium]|nr:DUF4445 domain-containing protein [Lachnospiraceae bacterium]